MLMVVLQSVLDAFWGTVGIEAVSHMACWKHSTSLLMSEKTATLDDDCKKSLARMDRLA